MTLSATVSARASPLYEFFILLLNRHAMPRADVPIACFYELMIYVEASSTRVSCRSIDLTRAAVKVPGR